MGQTHIASVNSKPPDEPLTLSVPVPYSTSHREKMNGVSEPVRESRVRSARIDGQNLKISRRGVTENRHRKNPYYLTGTIKSPFAGGRIECRC